MNDCSVQSSRASLRGHFYKLLQVQSSTYPAIISNELVLFFDFRYVTCAFSPVIINRYSLLHSVVAYFVVFTLTLLKTASICIARNILLNIWPFCVFHVNCNLKDSFQNIFTYCLTCVLDALCTMEGIERSYF